MKREGLTSFWIKSHFTKIINLIYTHIAHLQFKWDLYNVHYNIQRPLGITQVKKWILPPSQNGCYDDYLLNFVLRVYKTLKFFQLNHIKHFLCFLNFVLCLLKKLKHCILILYENNWKVRINSYKTKPFLSCSPLPPKPIYLFWVFIVCKIIISCAKYLFYAHRVVKYS